MQNMAFCKCKKGIYKIDLTDIFLSLDLFSLFSIDKTSIIVYIPFNFKKGQIASKSDKEQRGQLHSFIATCN